MSNHPVSPFLLNTLSCISRRSLKILSVQITLVVVLFVANYAAFSQCMMVPVSLEQRVTNASLIVEGRVIAKRSYWNSERTKIETENTIEIYKVFKGAINSVTVSLVTQGGMVGSDMLIVEPSLKLNIGDVGIFTITDNRDSTQLKAYATTQGFIKYDEFNHKAGSVFDAYDDYSSVYQQINKITGKEGRELKPYPILSDSDPVPLAAPSITGLSPTTLSAGTYSLLTITGSDFGSTPGSVNFPDANDGGATFITADPTLIQSWSDTEITIFVPTGATTGNIQVTNSTAETGQSSTTLTVPYNISGLNNSFILTADYTPDLVDNNGSGGYTFTFNEDYFTNTDAVNRYDEVIEQWRCESGINWGSAGASTTTTSCEGSDGINLVTFDDDCGLPVGVLGTAFSFYTACGTGGVAYWSVNELDIKFDIGRSWNFTLDPPAAGESDFYSVMLHEMGHAHQLGHSAIVSDVMYFQIASGTQKRTLNPNNVNAVNFIMSRNNANELAYNGSTGGSVVANACGAGSMVSDPCNVAPATAFASDNNVTCNSTLTANFTDQSTGSPTSWNWDFGDGSSSTQQNPSHTYSTPGAYNVTLTASNANGSSPLLRSNYIIVTGDMPTTPSCNPTSTNEGNFGLTVSNVTFESIDNTTSTLINVAYTDFSCSHIAAVNAGDSYNLSVTLNANNPGNFDLQCFVYIDFDDDGTFDISERVLLATQPDGGSGEFSASVAIPNSVTSDAVIRMRVIGEAVTLSGPCESNFVGDTEDYGLFINSVPLPITLAKFEVSQLSEKEVEVNWQTSSEINNDYFTIQRSKDGIDWEEVKAVQGNGNSSALLSYSITDTQPYLGISYYRLKQTDFDGQFSYSEVKKIDLTGDHNPQMRIYPNPNSGENLFLRLEHIPTKRAKLLITDIYGKTVFTQQITNLDSNLINSEVKLPQKLTPGLYAITLHFDSRKISQVLAVQ